MQEHSSVPLKYVPDILQSEEAFTVEEYKYTHNNSMFQTLFQTLNQMLISNLINIFCLI